MESVIKKANAFFFSKVVVNLLLIVFGAMMISGILSDVHTKTARSKQKESNELVLTEAISILNRNVESTETLTQVYHEGNNVLLKDVERLSSENLDEWMNASGGAIRNDLFEGVAGSIGAKYLFLLSENGKIVSGSDRFMAGRNPATAGLLTQENLNQLLKTRSSGNNSAEPVYVQNQFGSFYFYSKPVSFGTKNYTLVIGMDSAMLDIQIASLKDISAVLRRMAVSNDGLLFAVDKENSLFLYYNDGKTFLTGQKIKNAGLSERILSDNYSGIESILGQKYYCTSKAFGSDAVIVAGARSQTMISHNLRALFWSVFGFVVIMVLCLVYAVIVRNDFIRRAVKTDRIILRKSASSPSYFDKTIFAKVFPLMFLSVLVMFGISFYTQTLLEITEGVERSHVALQEVIGRYEEGAESRQVVENYYNSHFLAVSKLLAHIVEEEPEILNDESVHYHSEYDENGNRKYLLDDEGNRLKSVSKSERLQRLCDRNGIQAIYLFDESGHTIATNTPNWFFTLSQNEEDQSYPFRQVLDGKIDSYIQPVMTNDLSIETQYFGVTMHYYTTVDDNGNTVYVSKYAYENAAELENTGGEKPAGEITQHTSMLQIELDDFLSEQVLAPTSVASILSTNMLGDGFIVMFDTSSEHLCLYSPIETSIGKTSQDLNVSPKAFSGSDYYGFERVNGTTYFQLFRYLNEYFIATAIPKSNMFTTRFGVALTTAAVSLVLILFLILTVTVTSKEEEDLYETMSEKEAELGHNSAIFSIILPSGRSMNTVTAKARWDNKHVAWFKRSPEQKLGAIIVGILLALLVYFAISALGVGVLPKNSSIFRYILSGIWDRGFNIFALSACVLVMSSIVILIELVRIVVRLCTSLLGTRGETIGHLMLSVIKYGGTIGAIFYCMHLIGFDSRSLLASAGILSIVIGLGAQSLIKDILAGIFIVFEGEFRVGDIVTIDSYRGTVIDIGLRTTKILGVDGNIKIYNNSEISGVLNMTQQASVAATTISIEYGQDIDYVEEVLRRELPAIKENNPKILDGPTYLGVSNLGESGVDITVIARGAESDIKGITRYLNREVLKIFYRNGINVPFPNVTVSNLDMTGRKTIKDLFPDQEQDAKQDTEDNKQ